MKSAFEMIFAFQGYPLQKMRRKLASIQAGLLNSSLENDVRKRTIFDFHYNRNKSYRSFIGETVPDNWNDIPIISKSSFQTKLDNWLAQGYTKNNVFLNSTSGSSGIPLKLAKDKESHALSWALIEHRYQLIGLNVFQDLEARFYGIPLSPYSKYLKERLKDFIAKRVRFPIFNLSDEVLQAFYETFKEKRFAYLYGYPSSLVAFADYIIRNDRDPLFEVCPSLKVCITTSEMCFELDRSILKEAFGVKIFNEYGAAELGILAIQDAEGDWILNDEDLFIEILDENNQPVTNGNEGKIIVTSLYNQAMPFIRYELGDRGILKSDQKGPYRLLEKITGRNNDIAILPSGRKVPGATIGYITRSLLHDEAIIREIFVQQKATDSFLVCYSGTRDLTETERNDVRDLLYTYMEPGLNLKIERVDKIERQPSGKLKQFEKCF